MKQLLKKIIRKANEKANPEDYRIPMPIKFHEPKKREVKTVRASMPVQSKIAATHVDDIKEYLLNRIVPQLKELATFKVEKGFTEDHVQITVSVDVLEKKEDK